MIVDEIQEMRLIIASVLFKIPPETKNTSFKVDFTEAYSLIMGTSSGEIVPFFLDLKQGILHKIRGGMRCKESD